MRIDIPSVVDHFEKSAKAYARAYEAETIESHAFNIRKKIVTQLLPSRCGKTLDIGCGPAIMVDVLESRVEAYTGIDPAESMVQECKRKYPQHPKLSFQVGRIEYIHASDNYFDTSICMGVLEYLSEDDSALKELVRVTKKGGTIIITVPNRKSPYRIWRRLFFVPLRRFVRCSLLKKTMPVDELIVHKEYYLDSLKSVLRRYRCEIRNCSYYNFQIIPSPFDKWFKNLDLRLAGSLQALSCSPFGWLGTAMVLRLTKL